MQRHELFREVIPTLEGGNISLNEIKELMCAFNNPAALVIGLGLHAGESVDKPAFVSTKVVPSCEQLLEIPHPLSCDHSQLASPNTADPSSSLPASSSSLAARPRLPDNHPAGTVVDG